MSEVEESIGVAVCAYCQKRYRILKKHARIVGREIQCPKCKRSFVVAIQQPTPVEQAAVAQQPPSNGQPETAKGKPARKKKAEIRGTYFTVSLLDSGKVTES